MKGSTRKILSELITRYPVLTFCRNSIESALDVLIKCYKSKNKVLVCGNGGSAADSEHIVGELMKGFLLERKISDNDQKRLKSMFPATADYLIDNLQGGLPAISLVSQTAIMTAYENDKAPDLSFAQQVLGYGEQGDVLMAITTSGNSKNVIYAAQIAKFKGMTIITLTGEKGGNINEFTDILINTPSNRTYEIQEFHLPIYHALCSSLENEFFANEA